MAHSHRLARLHAALRRELRTRAKKRVDGFLAEVDPETGESMMDVLLTHIALGRTFELDIAVHVIGDEPAPEPESSIEVVRA